jgi:hypothetical protein
VLHRETFPFRLLSEPLSAHGRGHGRRIRHRDLVCVRAIPDLSKRNGSAVTLTLAQKYMLLLETLRRGSAVLNLVGADKSWVLISAILNRSIRSLQNPRLLS